MSLEVVIDNNSNCQLDWSKNGNKITEGGKVSLVSHKDGRYSLIIRDTEDDDSGEYCCVAQNEAGKVTCTGKLSVERKYSTLCKVTKRISTKPDILLVLYDENKRNFAWKEPLIILRGKCRTFLQNFTLRCESDELNFPVLCGISFENSLYSVRNFVHLSTDLPENNLKITF